MYRQGDVLVWPVQKIPGSAQAGIRDNGKIVLAYGEVTGHSHSIAESATELLDYEGARYLLVPVEGASLKHEEHETIELPAGEYRIITQREYTPKAIVNVLD